MSRAAIAIVVLHLLVSVIHGAAHNVLAINLSGWQNAYVLSIITILPLVAALLIWRRRAVGFMLLLLSMFGSLVFGVYYHFIFVSPDNVAFLPHHTWTLPFQLTAWLLAVIEAAGVVIGLRGITRRQPEQLQSDIS